ncbi:MAG: hypothetical protein MJZ81_04995 [Bacteroidales bacterium]|nr:hypothetical protein [Bacteroidales bacterium]
MRYKKLFLFLVLMPFLAKAQLWQTYDMSNSEISGNTILAITTDKKDAKWVGTNLGLCRLQSKTWTDYADFNDKLKDQFVNCLTVDNRGVLWIGTDDYGVIEFNGSTFNEHTAEVKRLGMKFIRAIAVDKNDVKWIGVTLGGLVKYNGKTWDKYTQDNSGLLSDFILCVAIDRQNNKWIGTNDGLCVFDDAHWTNFTTKNSGLPHNIVPSIVIDKAGNKWLGTLGGLCKFDGTNWKVFNTQNSPIPSDQVNWLTLDANGTIWIATNNGVACFDGKSNWRVYPARKGELATKTVHNVVVDAQGHKWFGTDFKGLCRYSGQVISGMVRDDKGKPKSGITVEFAGKTAVTDEQGKYSFEVASGTSGVLKPQLEGYECTPAQMEINAIKAFSFNRDFIVSGGMMAKGNSTEKVMVTPYLAEGYITVSMESPVAEVEFVDAQGNTVRTIPQYKNGAKITITKMPRINYTMYIRTAKGEKSLKFNLK